MQIIRKAFYWVSAYFVEFYLCAEMAEKSQVKMVINNLYSVVPVIMDIFHRFYILLVNNDIYEGNCFEISCNKLVDN